jgi:hypothetical protein
LAAHGLVEWVRRYHLNDNWPRSTGSAHHCLAIPNQILVWHQNSSFQPEQLVHRKRQFTGSSKADRALCLRHGKEQVA